MRLIIVCLTALLVLIQYPLWLGKGGWLTVHKLDGQVTLARAKNEELKARNAKLASEVSDLKQGTGAVEERARYELGMIRQNEIFVQVLDANGAPVAPDATPPKVMPVAPGSEPPPPAKR
ncbi:MAG: cell division protein FtsB [Herbaspirillum sp.]|jgi:cell division protein FtsB|nr:cell division protein FtsB [Herbaspirillum sp.]